MESALHVPILHLVKTEEVTPMEVSSNSASFKVILNKLYILNKCI